MPSIISVDIDIEVKPEPIINTKPYFKSALKKLLVYVGESISYTLPSTADD